MNWFYTNNNEETGNEPVFDPDVTQSFEEEKKEDIDQEEESEEISEEEEIEDDKKVCLELKLDYAQNTIKEQESYIKRLLKKYEKYKKNYNKAEREKENNKYLIETNDGKIRYKTLEEIKDLTVYDDQRPINKKHVEDIKKHQLEYFDMYNRFHDSLPLIVAIQPNGTPSFINKRNERKSTILIDGQHRLAALNKILDSAGDNHKKFSKVYLTVKYIKCEDMDEVHEEFISINKGIALTKSDLDKNKRDYNISEEIINFIERLEEDDFFSCKSRKNGKKLRQYIYIKVLRDRINDSDDFTNLMRTQNIKASELIGDFVSFNKTRFMECSEIDFDTFRKNIGVKKKLSKKMEGLKNKLLLYKSTHDIKCIKNILSYVYHNKYELLVNDFMDFIKETHGFDNEDEDEDSESE